MIDYQSFAVTATGSSHTKHGKECQDCSLSYPPKGLKNLKVITASVADGHGDDSCFRSRTGAVIASSCGTVGMYDFINKCKAEFEQEDEERDEKVAKDLIKHIIANWQLKVEEDYTKNPFTPDELAKVSEKYRKRYENGESLNKAYGTTLIASAITEHYWLGIHIGDGRFTVLNHDGTFAQPIPWDDRCHGYITTSICDDDAFERARVKFFPITPENPPPVAVFLCSDGVDDNYPMEENEKHLYKLYKTIALAFAEDGFESTCEQLKALAEKFATEGKGDDTSIAGFIDMEELKKVKSIWDEEK